MQIPSPHIHVLPDPAAELDRLGDEIAELSAHLEAATDVCERLTGDAEPSNSLP